jgi:hypothetical protein
MAENDDYSYTQFLNDWYLWLRAVKLVTKYLYSEFAAQKFLCDELENDQILFDAKYTFEGGITACPPRRFFWKRNLAEHQIDNVNSTIIRIGPLPELHDSTDGLDGHLFFDGRQPSVTVTAERMNLYYPHIVRSLRASLYMPWPDPEPERPADLVLKPEPLSAEPEPAETEPQPEPSPPKMKRSKWLDDYLTAAKRTELANYDLQNACEIVNRAMAADPRVDPFENSRSIEQYLTDTFPLRRSPRRRRK